MRNVGNLMIPGRRIASQCKIRIKLCICGIVQSTAGYTTLQMLNGTIYKNHTVTRIYRKCHITISRIGGGHNNSKHAICIFWIHCHNNSKHDL